MHSGTSSVEKYATEIRNLQRTEIRELEEGFAKGQRGSSAMPHKRNPSVCEQLSGLAPLLPALRAHWKPILVGAAGLVAFGLLFSWHVSKVREARTEERALCAQEKRESRDTADEIDRRNAGEALAAHLAELAAERVRTLAAEAQSKEYQDEIASLPEQIRMCRRATDADVRRLR